MVEPKYVCSVLPRPLVSPRRRTPGGPDIARGAPSKHLNSPPTGPTHLAFWQRELTEPEFAYVMQGEPGTPIKVGKGNDPVGRLAEFQTGNHAELHLLYVAPGGYALERELHYRLRDSQVRGEWFAEPGIEGFLVWFHLYCETVKKHFETYGELPPLPITPKDPAEYHIRRGANVIHRWRMSQPSESPVTVRYMKPEPLSAEEIQERRRKAWIEHDIAKTRTFG